MLPKVGKVRIKQHRAIPEDRVLKSVTISQTPSGKYYASILYEYETEIKSIELKKAIGLDFSMADLFVSSEDELKVDEDFLHRYRRSRAKLAKEQRTCPIVEKTAIVTINSVAKSLFSMKRLPISVKIISINCPDR